MQLSPDAVGKNKSSALYLKCGSKKCNIFLGYITTPAGLEVVLMLVLSGCNISLDS